LRVLIAARRRAEAEGQRLVLANVREPVRRTLTLAQADELFPEI
jgi:anti-anti-sigma regulatory factor